MFTILVSLLASAAGVVTAPTPERLINRGRPNLYEVIRNPVPIDAGLHLGIDPAPGPLELPGLDVDLHLRRRAAFNVEKEVEPVVVVDRS
ncbi:hypothetical protein ACEQ8H_004956 [Pleosporales sp. CAS-2024a]